MEYSLEKGNLVMVGKTPEEVFKLGLMANKFSKVSYKQLIPKVDSKDNKSKKSETKDISIEISIELTELVERIAFSFQNRVQ